MPGAAMSGVAVGRTTSDLHDSVTPGVTEGGEGPALRGKAVIDVGREGGRPAGPWKQGGRMEGLRGNLRPRREAGVGDLMRVLVCVRGSTVLVWTSGEAAWITGSTVQTADISY